MRSWCIYFGAAFVALYVLPTFEAVEAIRTPFESLGLGSFATTMAACGVLLIGTMLIVRMGHRGVVRLWRR